MTINLKNVLARAETWSEQDQEELAQVALEIERSSCRVGKETPDRSSSLANACLRQCPLPRIPAWCILRPMTVDTATGVRGPSGWVSAKKTFR